MHTTYIKLWVGFALLLLLATPFQAGAEVEWRIENTLKTGQPPLDVAVSADGQSIFVLTSNGSVLIYDRQGKLEDTINVGSHIDQIRMGPDDDQIFATSRQHLTVEVITLNFIHEINVKGSPFKGPPDAPVVIAVFSDFQ